MSTVPKHTFAEDRRRTILAMLDHTESVQVTEIARALGVSNVTARSDLDALAADGKLRRTHGGAVSLHRTLSVSVQDRRINVNAQAKRRIALRSLELVRDGDTILVDSGTTALEFVRALDTRRNVTVITADLTVANVIDEGSSSVNVVLLGGALRKGHRYLYGPLTRRSLEMVHADLSVLCPGSFVPRRGFMTDFAQMAEIKAEMSRAANHRIALLDASKIEAHGTYRFAGLCDVEAVVCDTDPHGVLARCIAEEPEATRPRLLLAPEED